MVLSHQKLWLSSHPNIRRPTSVGYAAKRTPAAIFAFDLLELRGKDVRYLDHVGESGHRLFQIAEQLGLEGIVAKHGGAPYRRGRASGWLKVKPHAGRLIDEQRAKWNE